MGGAFSMSSSGGDAVEALHSPVQRIKPYGIASTAGGTTRAARVL